MKSVKKSILILTIILYALCSATLCLFAVDFLISSINSSYALPADDDPTLDPDIDGGIIEGGDPNVWNSWVGVEPVPECNDDEPGIQYGFGTAANPYQIYSQDDLFYFWEIANNRGATTGDYDGDKKIDSGETCGIIMKDFTCTYYSYGAVGDVPGHSYVHEEQAVIILDGNYKRIHIEGYFEESLDVSTIGGLFGSARSVEVSNLKLTGTIKVDTRDGSRPKAVGGLVGRCCSTNVTNCYIAVDIDVAVPAATDNHHNNVYVAGIVGMASTWIDDEKGYVTLKDTVFCGKMNVNANVTSRGSFSTGGSAGEEFNSQNSYYKYQLNDSDWYNSYPNEQNIFNDAYDLYITKGENPYVDGAWETQECFKYYYSAPPNILWLINRTRCIPTNLAYCIEERGTNLSPDKDIHPIAYTAFPKVKSVELVSENKFSINYTEFGRERPTHYVQYDIPSGYELRGFNTHTESQDASTLLNLITIVLDCKINVRIVAGSILAGSIVYPLDDSRYTISKTSTLEKCYPDQIEYDIIREPQKLKLTLTNAEDDTQKATILITLADVPSPFICECWEARTANTRKRLTVGSSIDAYRDMLVYETATDSYVLKLYMLVKLKSYNITFN